MGRQGSGDRGSRNRTSVERRSDRELVVKRDFDAPARVVFEAWTKPELLAQWWTPRSRGVSLFDCQAEVRAGGAYRYVFGRDPAHPMAFSGRYTEVAPPSHLVWTQRFEEMPDAGEAVITAAFEERGGKTALVLVERFASKQALDGTIASGMEEGMRETFDQLEELVVSLA